LLAIQKERVTQNKKKPTMTPCGVMTPAQPPAQPPTESSETEEWIWVKRYMRTVEDQRFGEDLQAKQAEEFFKDYMKMVEGRKKRQTERELCRLMWAWIVLKRRHERRHRKGKDVEKIEATTPTRKVKARTPESPSNPADELRTTSKELLQTEMDNEIKQAAMEEQPQARIIWLKQRKRELEQSFHKSQIKHHRVEFQGVLNDIKRRKGMNGKLSVIIQQLKRKPKKKRYESVFEAALLEDWEGWGAEADEADWYTGWYDWHDNNQPAVTKQKTIMKQDAEEIKARYRMTMMAADKAIQDARAATATTDENSNSYFWHRGRPPE
jgi:hypothetical protein